MDDNLDTLDNTSLRKKCIQYGLPNVPVTDSSRKVLIRRLRVSMGGGGDKATKPREATAKKTTTLNTTASEKVTPRKSQSRRATAEAPLPKVEAIKPHIETASFVPRSTVDKNLSVFNNYITQQEEVRPLQRASSLTPSEKLAISGVVTTSYSQETTVLEDDYEDDPYISQFQPERITTRTLPSYQVGQGLAHPVGGFFKNSENQSYISKTADRNITRSSPSTALPSYAVSSGSNYLGSDRSYARNTVSSLSQPKIGINKPSLTRRYTEYTTIKDSGDDEDDEVDEVQTPYLSSFARSLDRLKSGEATKLTPSGPIRKQTSLYGQRPLYGYSSATAEDDSVSGALRQFVIALEQKYQLKRAFAIFLVFVLAVFIYVFFIM